MERFELVTEYSNSIIRKFMEEGVSQEMNNLVICIAKDHQLLIVDFPREKSSCSACVDVFDQYKVLQYDRILLLVILDTIVSI